MLSRAEYAEILWPLDKQHPLSFLSRPTLCHKRRPCWNRCVSVTVGQQHCLCLGLTHRAVVINSWDCRNCQKRAYEVKEKKKGKATVSVSLHSGPRDLESAGNDSLPSLHGINNQNQLLEPQRGCRRGLGRRASQVAPSLQLPPALGLPFPREGCWQHPQSLGISFQVLRS